MWTPVLLRGGRDGEISHMLLDVAWRTQITVDEQQETDRGAGLQVFVPSSRFVFKLCFHAQMFPCEGFPGVQRRTALRNDCRLLDGSQCPFGCVGVALLSL